MKQFIKKILQENSRDLEDKKLWKLMQQVGIVSDWGLKRTKSDSLKMEVGMWKFTFRIEPIGAKLKDVIASMPSSYSNVSSSRSYLLKLITGRIPIQDKKTRAELDKAQKVFYKAQQPLINALEEKLSVMEPIFHPTGFAYSGKGDTLWEMWIDDMNMQKFDEGYFEKHFLGTKPIPGSPDDPAMEDVPPPAPIPPKPKPKKERKPKHILPPKELEGVIQKLMSSLSVTEDGRMTGAEALNDYMDVVQLVDTDHGDVGENLDWVVVSDSYNDGKRDLVSNPPNVVEVIITTSRKVVKRSEWNQLSQGKQPYQERPKEDELLTMQGRKTKSGRSQNKFVAKPKTGKTAGKPHRTKRTNPTTNPSRREMSKKQLSKEPKLSKKSRYGGPEGKTVRKTQQATRTYDEIAVYAHRVPAKNKFTRKERKYGGNVEYYFFKIVPKEGE